MSRGAAGDYQADEQEGFTRLSWPQSSRRAGRCRAAQMAIIKQMTRQVSCGSLADYQTDELAGVQGLTGVLSVLFCFLPWLDSSVVNPGVMSWYLDCCGRRKYYRVGALPHGLELYLWGPIFPDFN